MEPDRVVYSPINDRPRLELPNGARVAVWIAPNIEHYEYLPDPVRVRDPWPRMPHPDVYDYGIKDYGNRVGVWRMFETMDRCDIRCTVSLNFAVIEHYPEIFEAMEARRWDVMCHGLYNTQYLWGVEEDEEREFIARCIEMYRQATGRMLPGWFSPAASFTLNTPDLVAEAGIKYYCDWYHDDQPFPMKVKSGQLITVPYTMEINDAIVYRRPVEADDFAQLIRDYFDTVWREGETQPRVMCVALHPYMMGQPHRQRHLEEAIAYMRSHDGVWFATAEEIADHYYATSYDGMVQHLDGEG